MHLTTLDGRYRIVESIAAGGMGEVFRAHDAVLAREVAIKVLHRSLAGDQGFVDRFRREARAAAVINHPNIVAVYDWGAVDGIYYMVMEFVHGQSVREILNRAGRLAPAQATDVLTQVLAALEHAHRAGIVHRDIKPENVIITPDGIAKVADFGLARAYAEATATQAGTVTGTVQYLAPEQIRGEPADPRTDLYSVGVVAYELLTGKLPYTGETAMAIAYKHLSNRVPKPSSTVADLPRGLDGFVASATERDRELRPESAAEMRRDLEAEARLLAPAKPLKSLVEDRPVVIPDAGPERAETVTIPRAEPDGPRRRRWPRRVLLAILFLGLLAAAAWGAWTYVVPHSSTVPKLIGAPVGRAQIQLEDLGFVVRLAKGDYSTLIDRGDVIRVIPKSGTELDRGREVVLVGSLGPRPVDIPDLRDQSLARAREALERAGLELGRSTGRFDEKVPKGVIVSQSPAPSRGQAPEGSQVDVVLSKGPPPVEVTDVVGDQEAAAREALNSLGFPVATQEQFSESVDAGSVISQSPDGGVDEPKGSTITIVVSKGPPRVRLPSFEGMTSDAAIARIRSLGLVPVVEQVPSGNGDRVVGQTPRPDDVVGGGSRVTIFVA